MPPHHPGMPGMGAGGMPGTATFAVPAGPGAGARPMRARMHAQPGMAAPVAPRRSMHFEMKGPQSIPQMVNGGTMVWKCEGPCEFTFGPEGARFTCQGSCEISQTTDAGDLSTDAGDDVAEFAIDDADLAIEGGDDDFGGAAGAATFTFSGDEDGEDGEDADDDGCEGSDGDCCKDLGYCVGSDESGGSQCEEESGDDSDHDADDEDDDGGDSSIAASNSLPIPAI